MGIEFVRFVEAKVRAPKIRRDAVAEPTSL